MFTVEALVKYGAVIFVIGLIASLVSMIRMSGKCTQSEEESERQQKLAH